ncbi:MAG: hypothetical protein K1X70_03310 [Leptospirales bacterium]|nr:hypothetical protein [Leptospirales bacterium]HMU81988.1 hypothetical protein [Leptospiraceae bacterium]HNL00325.1 hypothetical protein [Leptospiraceae bacterium]HNN60036.1 hypothetical protein [Leptospiraceae bacterium]HNN73974.1 hypothetical protein [Leptospiraceae bacterium]
MPPEFQTPSGVKITVADSGAVEAVQPGGSGRQFSLPRLAMIGQTFAVGASGHQLVPIKKGKLLVRYRLLSESEDRILQITSPVADIDQAPVLRSYHPDVRDFLNTVDPRKASWTVVLDEGIPRIDLMSLKVKFPSLQTLVLHPVHHTEEEDHRRVRATDLVSQGKAEQLAQNPVFLARLHLRNLELDQVKRLVTDFPMTAEELDFVRTFLQIMIRNDRKQADLAKVASALKHLDELFRMASLLEQGMRDMFDQEMDRMNPAIARDLLGLVQKRRTAAPEKEDQIYFWECEFRLSKIAEKTA